MSTSWFLPGCHENKFDRAREKFGEKGEVCFSLRGRGQWQGESSRGLLSARLLVLFRNVHDPKWYRFCFHSYAKYIYEGKICSCINVYSSYIYIYIYRYMKVLWSEYCILGTLLSFRLHSTSLCFYLIYQIRSTYSESIVIQKKIHL